MSNPQTENGYTRIANELLEALCRFEFSKCEYQIILAIIRKTYGYQKKADNIGNTQLAQMTGIERSNVARTIRNLIEKKILLRNTDTYTHTVGINKHYDEWDLIEKSSSKGEKSKKTVVTHDHSLQESMVMRDHSLIDGLGNNNPIVDQSLVINDADSEKSVVKNEDFLEQSVVTGDTPSVVKFDRIFSKSVVTDDTYKRKVKESEKKTPPPRGVLIANGNAQEKMCGSGDVGIFCDDLKKINGVTTLVFPNSLCALERETAVTLLQPCGLDAQAVLDVLAATIKAGRVQTSALGLLGGLVRRYVAGTFDPAPGLKIKIEREKVNTTPRPEKPKLPVDKAKNLQHLAAFRRDTNLR